MTVTTDDELASPRLANAELRARMTAASRVLELIARSPSDPRPVFDAIAESARELTGASYSSVARLESGLVKIAALCGWQGEAVAAVNRSYPRPAARDNPLAVAIIDGEVQNIADALTSGLNYTRELQAISGYRSLLVVPMMREQNAIGAICVFSREVNVFQHSHVDLLKNFANQAVIAIENARLFGEVQAKTQDLEEALRYQTGSANILNVIAMSPTDIAPVLQAIVESACQFCDAADAAITLKEGDQLRFRAHHGSIPLTVDLRPINRNWVNGRAVIDKIPVHVHDLFSADGDEFPEGREMATRHKIRTLLSVPLLRKDEAIGTIALRRIEAHPFSDKQIALLRSFADQAVIAIQNVKLFDEVQAKTRDLEESLQQQTATADVLKVISRSAFDIQTVLDALLASACRLCEADIGTIRYQEGGDYWLAATFGCKPEWIDHLSHYSTKPDRGSIFGRTIVDGRTVHFPDVLADPDFQRQGAQNLMGFRAALGVPLVRDGQTFGVISVMRFAVGPFSEKQIELIQTFADQAVIAIENVRLFDEVQTKTRDLEESLQQQTTTSDVLKTISRSTFDLQTVLDTLIESAARLCGAPHGLIFRFDGTSARAVAAFNNVPGFKELWADNPIPLNGGTATGRALVERRAIHIPDVLADREYDPPEGSLKQAQRLGQYRTTLVVPMMREGLPLGTITLWKTKVEPFTDRQIELVTTFADQAAIAIENTRLFAAEQQRTSELAESLAQQTATADVLKVISRSAFDLQTVLDTLVSSAARLCDADNSHIFLRDGEVSRLAACSGFSPEYEEFMRRRPIGPGRGSLVGRTMSEKKIVHLPDAVADPEYTAHEAQRLGRFRTMLGIPMLRDGVTVGVLSVTRSRVMPFTDKQIELVQTFADQAVIAIENTRLFAAEQQRTSELAESLAQQTATADVLKVISRSTVELKTVLDALLETAARLCHADQSYMSRRHADGLYYVIASHGASEEGKAYVESHPFAPDRGTTSGRVALEHRPIHIPDVLADPEYTYSEAQQIAGFRTMLGLPLLREDTLIGIFIIGRSRVEPFTDKEVELLTTFADQAVIAIENARLFEELRDRQAELRVTFDNMGDGVVMFGADTRLVAWNRNFQEMLELPDAFLAERPSFAEYFRYLADRGEYVSADLETQLGRTIEDTGLEMRYERTRPDGHVIEVRRNPVPGGAFVLIYSDITERKRAEEAIRAARDAAESALRDLQAAQDRLVQTQKLASLGQLTAGIAHEIKNPLNFVNNFSGVSVELTDELQEMLGRVTADDKTRREIVELANTLRDNLDRIVQHGKRADSIVKNMLLHSREGSGEHRPVEINAIIDESLNLAYHGARAEKQGFNITLERDFDPAIGLADIYPQEVTRVLLNLISNGFYAATQRAGATGNSFEPTLKAVTRNLGDRVEVRIRDNGMGIPPDIQEKIFNPFFTTKPAGEGTGLGLSMSHDIVVKQHGGTIEVVTEPGSFTEFIITLPRVMP